MLFELRFLPLGVFAENMRPCRLWPPSLGAMSLLFFWCRNSREESLGVGVCEQNIMRKPRDEVGPLSSFVWLWWSPQASSSVFDMCESKTRKSSGSQRVRDRNDGSRGLGLCSVAGKRLFSANQASPHTTLQEHLSQPTVTRTTRKQKQVKRKWLQVES